MIPAHLMTAEVVLTHRDTVAVDRYNLPSGASKRTETVLAYYRPRRTESVVDGGEQVVAGMLLYLQPDVVTDHIESVQIEGKRYAPDGQAQPHWHPQTSKVMYQTLLLRRGTLSEVS
jgi:hypothetical protein